MAAEEQGLHHIIPSRIYYIIWATLIVFTGLTVFASEIDLGPWNVVVALAIATIKGTLVVLFFMHLKYSSKMTIVTVIASMFWLFLLLSLSMTDYLTRGWLTYPGH